MDIQFLTSQIAAVAPITGVSVGLVSDKSTWRVDYQDTATAQQQQAAQAVITAFDPNAVTQAALRQADMLADTTVDTILDKLKNATSAQIDAYFQANVTTAAQAIATLKAVVKVLAYAIDDD